MNNWNFTGHLGDDCKMSATSSGKTVCQFSVAVNSGYGENKKTTWATCAIFGRLAEGNLPSFLKKGTQVAVTGQLTLDVWVDQQGAERKTLKVLVNNLDLIGGVAAKPSAAAVMSGLPNQQQPQQNNNQFQQAGSHQAQNQPAQNPNQSSAPQYAPFDDDVPF